jgi:hypothetical protein
MSKNKVLQLSTGKDHQVKKFVLYSFSYSYNFVNLVLHF